MFRSSGGWNNSPRFEYVVAFIYFLEVNTATDRVPKVETMFPPPPALSDNFIGRSDLIEAIVSFHVSPQSPSTRGHRKTVLHGIGGIGKTQLSIRIAHELQSRYVH
jgi:Holliday junction resolvasome RuvABC ATP-dependent DNA helicase subunit